MKSITSLEAAQKCKKWKTCIISAVFLKLNGLSLWKHKNCGHMQILHTVSETFEWNDITFIFSQMVPNYMIKLAQDYINAIIYSDRHVAMVFPEANSLNYLKNLDCKTLYMGAKDVELSTNRKSLQNVEDFPKHERTLSYRRTCQVTLI